MKSVIEFDHSLIQEKTGKESQTQCEPLYIFKRILSSEQVILSNESVELFCKVVILFNFQLSAGAY